MKRVRLGNSDLIVSRLGLGTMNFGTQLDAAQAHRILDHAFDHGINLVDTAELYASPPSAETYGRSEEIVGAWLKGRARGDVVLASKMVGPPVAPHFAGQHIRDGQTRITARFVAQAVEASLRRLGTDCIDLYYVHWPDRFTPFAEQVGAMEAMVRAGKIRRFAASNESAWGLMRLIAAAEAHGGAKPACVQNELSLIRPAGWNGVEEVCREEGVGFIGFSPLAMGLLSGKYAQGGMPEGSRFARYERYRSAYAVPAHLALADRVAEKAAQAGVPVATAAFWWALTRPSVDAVLTSLSDPAQLSAALDAETLAESGPPDFLDDF